MDAIEQDQQNRIQHLQNELDLHYKNKPEFINEKEKWDAWSERRMSLEKFIHYIKTHRTSVTKGQIIVPPVIMVGRKITIKDDKDGIEYIVHGVGDVPTDQWTNIENKIHKLLLDTWVIKLGKAIEGFIFTMERERYSKMKDWDYAMVMYPIDIEVRPEGFFITSYTIISRDKKNMVNIRCDYALDDRKVIDIIIPKDS